MVGGPVATAPARPRASRRSIIAGAAWAAPVVVVASAAPAFAASACEVTDYAYAVDWGTSVFSRSSDASAVVTATPSTAGTSALTVTFARTMNGRARATANNLTVPTATNIGNLGAGERGLLLEQTMTRDQTSRNNNQTVTMTFSRPVTGLTFTITDIDSATGSYWDRIELSGSPQSSFPAPSTVTGAGSVTSPWRQPSDNTPTASTSGAGNVLVTYPGTVSTLTMVYWNADGSGNQLVMLGDFAFSAKGC
jgi:hypothetical protein